MVEEVKRAPGAAMPDFSVAPEDVLNTRIQDVVGSRFMAKRGDTER